MLLAFTFANNIYSFIFLKHILIQSICETYSARPKISLEISQIRLNNVFVNSLKENTSKCCTVILEYITPSNILSQLSSTMQNSFPTKSESYYVIAIYSITSISSSGCIYFWISIELPISSFPVVWYECLEIILSLQHDSSHNTHHLSEYKLISSPPFSQSHCSLPIPSL